MQSQVNLQIMPLLQQNRSKWYRFKRDLADNSSIDTIHIGDGQVTAGKIAANTIQQETYR